MNYANACRFHFSQFFFQLSSCKFRSRFEFIYFGPITKTSHCPAPSRAIFCLILVFLMSFPIHSVLYRRVYATKLLGTRENKCWNRVSANRRRFFFLAAVRFEWIETSLVRRFQVFPTAISPKPCVPVIYDLFYILLEQRFSFNIKWDACTPRPTLQLIKKKKSVDVRAVELLLSHRHLNRPRPLNMCSVHHVCMRNCYFFIWNSILTRIIITTIINKRLTENLRNSNLWNLRFRVWK